MLFLCNLFLPDTKALFLTPQQKDFAILSLPESRHRRSSTVQRVIKQDMVNPVHRTSVRRGLNIEVKVAKKRPSLKFDLLRELEKELLNMSSADEFEELTPCPECDVPKKEKRKELKVKPAYPCDEWDLKSRTCWLDRNIGDTVTFVLAFGKGYNPKVQWRQEFHSTNSKSKKFYIIDPENPLWNIVIGSRGHELRLSPITEIDIDFNSFSAHVLDEKAPLVSSLHKVNFRIRIMPIDQGFVYPGETLIISMRRINLPPTSMSFKWYLESDGESGTLPSNMKLSPSGAVLSISELRKEQEGILSCSIYTNLGLFATKQRFLIKEMNQSNNMLLFMPTRPTHFNEQKRRRRQLDYEYYSNQDMEDEQKEDSKLQDTTKSELKNLNSVGDRPKHSDYSIEKIDVYRKEHDEDSFRKNNLDEQASSFRKELEERQMNEELKRQQDQKHFTSSNGGATKNRHLKINKENAGNIGDQIVPDADEISHNNKENIFLEIERKPTRTKVQAQDKFSKLISKCQTDSQCSVDATCVLRDLKLSHFCRCNSGYQGNGIFCWEDIKTRNSDSSWDYQIEQDYFEQTHIQPPITEAEKREHI